LSHDSQYLTPPGTYFMMGNEACVEGALYAGCRFFAAYPITPATEIGERMSVRMLQVDGIFIQMEDEIGSICSVIGASLAGKKAMTATASAGYNLMLESLGYSVQCEVPLVITDVQRTRGYIHASQADVMQSRWGPSGDHQMIVLSPSSVQESFDFQIEAFNLAEQYRNPVILLTDETVAHMREKVTIPRIDQMKIINRKEPNVPPDEYLPFAADESGVPPMSKFGDGYNVLYTINPHDERGYNIWSGEIFNRLQRRLSGKIKKDADRIFRYKAQYLDDCEIVVVAYGIVARSAAMAVRQAREKGRKVGLLKLNTLWPSAEESLRELTGAAKRIIVPEMNLGQYVQEIERVTKKEVFSLTKTTGAVFKAQEILSEIERVY
jgi:2-oxoglutarate/2-oxoacid ferredoxin oxidoreductase subunit alpha